MKIILKDEIENLGRMGEIVTVKNGYARNFLIPKGMAVVADQKNVRALQHEIRVIQQKAAKLQKMAIGLKERFEATQVSVSARVGEEEKLFGSVTSKDIAEALKAQGLEVDRRRIVLSEPIKSLGEHEVTVRLGHDIQATVKVTVTAEGGAPSPVAETPAQ